MRVLGIVPARLDSKRFPNKLLELIDGISIIDRVLMNANNFGFLDKLIVATDSIKIVNYCNEINQEVFYMKDDVSCGSERAYYVSKEYKDYDLYITIPADEPFIDSEAANKMFKSYKNIEEKDLIYTCGSKFYDLNRLKSSRSCKIIQEENRVVYFSRSVIPFSKEGILPINNYIKHIGIFLFDSKLFEIYKPSDIWSRNKLSQLEGLEQIMFLSKFRVSLLELDHKLYGIDIKQDILDIEEKLK